MIRSTTWLAALAALVLAPARARAEDAASVEATATPETPATPSDLDLRLTLSSFLYRETGEDAGALVDQGAPLDNASPVQRYFGDLRLELTDGGLAVDARVRQTTSQRFQSGAAGGGEYDVRTLAYRLGNARTGLTLGRQYIDAVGATKIDGAAFDQRLASSLGAVAFAGAAPVLGSRSLDTDYPRIVNDDGSKGSLLVPVAGGLGLVFQHARYHGDLGVAAIYVPQTVPNATSEEASRVFATSSGYLRAGSAVEVYHFAILDVAGQAGVSLTNGSLGVTAHPTPAIQLSAAVNHVSTDALQIATRNLLADPDPSANGIIENNLAVIRVSQDAARAGASLALAHQRFELSASAGLHRRPEVSVELADGSGQVVFPEARSADATFGVLDRRSIGGLRASLTASLGAPIGDHIPNAARSTTVRVAAGRMFARERGQLEVDMTAARFKTTRGMGTCTTSLDVFACYGATTTTAAQAGALASWRVSREWLLLADVHVGHRTSLSTTTAGMTDWPPVWAVTSFVRAQWRYH